MAEEKFNKFDFHLVPDGFLVNGVFYKASLIKCNTAKNIIENVNTVLKCYFGDKVATARIIFSSKEDKNAEKFRYAIWTTESGKDISEFTLNEKCCRVDGIFISGLSRLYFSSLRNIDEKSFKYAITKLLRNISYEIK